MFFQASSALFLESNAIERGASERLALTEYFKSKFNVKQETEYFCAPACVKAVIEYWRSIASNHQFEVDSHLLMIEDKQNDLATLFNTTEESGTDPRNIKAALTDIDIHLDITETSSFPDSISYLLGRGMPVIVIYRDSDDDGHYGILHFKDDSHVIIADPNTGSNNNIPIQDFLSRWKNSEKGGSIPGIYMVIFPNNTEYKRYINFLNKEIEEPNEKIGERTIGQNKI